MNICDDKNLKPKTEWIPGHLYSWVGDGILRICVIDTLDRLILCRIDNGQKVYTGEHPDDRKYTNVNDQYCLRKVELD